MSNNLNNILEYCADFKLLFSMFDDLTQSSINVTDHMNGSSALKFGIEVPEWSISASLGFSNKEGHLKAKSKLNGIQDIIDSHDFKARHHDFAKASGWAQDIVDQSFNGDYGSMRSAVAGLMTQLSVLTYQAPRKGLFSRKGRYALDVDIDLKRMFDFVGQMENMVYGQLVANPYNQNARDFMAWCKTFKDHYQIGSVRLYGNKTMIPARYQKRHELKPYSQEPIVDILSTILCKGNSGSLGYFEKVRQSNVGAIYWALHNVTHDAWGIGNNPEYLYNRTVRLGISTQQLCSTIKWIGRTCTKYKDNYSIINATNEYLNAVERSGKFNADIDLGNRITNSWIGSYQLQNPWGLYTHTY